MGEEIVLRVASDRSSLLKPHINSVFPSVSLLQPFVYRQNYEKNKEPRRMFERESKLEKEKGRALLSKLTDVCCVLFINSVWAPSDQN